MFFHHYIICTKSRKIKLHHKNCIAVDLCILADEYSLFFLERNSKLFKENLLVCFLILDMVLLTGVYKVDNPRVSLIIPWG